MKAIQKALGIAALTLCAATAQAATISVVQPAAPIVAGSTFELTVLISGLDANATPSLADFDIDVTFDSTVLGYVGYSWGDPVHGDQLDLAHLGSFAIADESQAGAGFLNFFEVSYDDSSVLNAQQAGSFGLVTLTFNALAGSGGVSPFGIIVNALGDVNGNALTAQVQNASIHVEPVPVPSALPLFASALLLAGTARTRRYK